MIGRDDVAVFYRVDKYKKKEYTYLKRAISIEL